MIKNSILACGMTRTLFVALVNHTVLLGILLASSVVVQADENTQVLLEKLQAIKANKENYSAALNAGKDRVTLCGYCHGKDGNSVKPEVPNLAGQNAEYLFNQFNLFAKGTRKNYVMERLAQMITPEEQINIALFYGSLSVEPQSHIESSKKGEDIFQSFCFACHGKTGRGNSDMPRLAGQKRDFLVKTLKAFKLGKSYRKESPMVSIMKNIETSDIEPLADYLSTMP